VRAPACHVHNRKVWRSLQQDVGGVQCGRRACPLPGCRGHAAHLHARTPERELDVIVDGCARREIFFHTFKGRVPHVLNRGSASSTPRWRRTPTLRASSWCPWSYRHAQRVQPRGAWRARPAFAPTPLRRGILMPAYAGTLSRFPVPMSAAVALEVASRLAPTTRAPVL
jgi:hypothetical protein